MSSSTSASASPTASPPYNHASLASLTSATASTAASIAPSTVPTTTGLTPDVAFTTVPALLVFIAEVEVASAGSVDAVTVGGVTPAQWARIDHELTVVRGHKWRQFFFAPQKLLIITIPNQPHERLHLYPNQVLLAEVGGMGLEDAWDQTGSTRYPVATAVSASYGEGDSGGMPWPVRLDGSDWPTIVFEGGYTQSLASLRAKKNFWFAASGHDVQIVVLAKAFPEDRVRKRILVEQWGERPVTTPRPGATTTRSHAAATLQPQCIQTVTIVWAVQGTAYDTATAAQKCNPASFNVTRGPLCLEFARLFLRAPAGPAEHDALITDAKLKMLATRVWMQ